MPLDVAQAIILEEVEVVKQSLTYDRLEVDFMGGEPFMNFPLIKTIVEWLETLDVGFPISAFCPTNGTLVTLEKQEWLMEHRNTFAVGLSYDGTFAMQWQNRSATKIDIPFFLKAWPKQWIRITLSRDTLPFLCEGVLYLQSQGAAVQVAMAQGVAWQSDDAQVFAKELERLSSYYLQHEDSRPIEFLVKPMFSVGKRIPRPIRPCGAGRSLVTYDVDGRRYPCHMFTPIVLADRAVLLDCASFCHDEMSVDPGCVGCLYLNWCNTCLGFNWKNRGDAFMRDHSACEMVNVWARACCSFQINYCYKHRAKLGEVDGKQIRAALDAYKLMMNHPDDWKTMYCDDTRKEVRNHEG